MNQEQRKQYNKDYYSKNKDKILKTALTKQKCEFCDRMVIKNNIHIHQKLNICKRKAEQKAQQQKRNEELNILVSGNSKPILEPKNILNPEN
jgi:hypothetical protein